MRREILIAVMLMLARRGAQGGTPQAGQCPAPGASSGEVVSGQIVDEQGRPVPGAEVWSVQPAGHYPFPKAVSSPDGRFSLRRPSPRSEGYLITCPAGFRSAQVDDDDLPSGPLRLALRRLGRIAGRVVDPDGRPVAGAGVSAQLSGILTFFTCGTGAPPPLPCATGSSGKEGTTDPDGRFEIAAVTPGWYEVSTEARGLFQQTPSRLRVLSGETAETEIVIGQGPALSGRLLSAGGAPVAKAAVQLVESREPAWDRVWSTVTDAQGHFHFRGVAAGERRVRATVEGMGTAQRRVRIGAGETRVDLRLAPDRAIRGRVVDAGGAPVERAEIYVWKPGFPEAWTDEDGMFSLRLRGEGEEIEVRKKGFVTARWVPRERGGDEGAIGTEIEEIALEPAGEIVGQVTGAAPEEKIGIALEAPGGRHATAWASADGTYRIPAPEPGAWTFTVRAGTRTRTAEVEVANGEQVRLDVHFPPAVPVRGSVVDSHGRPAGLSSLLFVRQGSRVEALANEGGFFQVRLEDGAWRVRVNGARGVADQILLVAGSAIENLVLPLHPGALLEGSIPSFETGEVPEQVTARLDGGSQEVKGAVDHETGGYSFQHLSPGDWTVAARSGQKQASGRITVTPEDTVVRLDL
jgi:hypothetical protein